MDKKKSLPPKNPHAQALGALGGRARTQNLSAKKIKSIASLGGHARAAKLTPGELSRIGKAARAAHKAKAKRETKGEN